MKHGVGHAADGRELFKCMFRVVRHGKFNSNLQLNGWASKFNSIFKLKGGHNFIHTEMIGVCRRTPTR